MAERVRIPIRPLLGLAMLALGSLCACGPGGGTAAVVPSPVRGVGDVLHRSVPARIAALPLVDEHGRRRTLASLHGKVVVLADVLTTCREVCPLTSANLRLMQGAIVKAGLTDKVEFVEVTVDPQRDSPARLLAYQKLYHPAQDWESWSGTPTQLAAFWQFFGVAYQRVPADDPPPIDWLTGRPSSYDVQHTDALVYLDANGQERYLIVGVPRVKGAGLPPRMRSYLSAEGRTNLTHPGREAWTLRQGLRALGWMLHTEVPVRGGE